jgi:hypothetical protein
VKWNHLPYQNEESIEKFKNTRVADGEMEEIHNGKNN